MSKINAGDEVVIRCLGSIFDGLNGVVLDKLPFCYSLRYTVRIHAPASILNNRTGYFKRRELELND